MMSCVWSVRHLAVQCPSQANAMPCLPFLGAEPSLDAHHKKLQVSLIVLVQPDALEGGKDAAAWACPPLHFQHCDMKEA